MNLESIFCVDRDFDSLEMGDVGEISRIAQAGGAAGRLSDDVPVAWGSDDGELNRAFGRRRGTTR